MSIQVTSAQDGETRWVVADRIRFLGGPAGANLELVEVEIPPGSGTPPHSHASPELFYILDGEITIRHFAAGKPPEGRLRLSARHQGNIVILEVEDDGRGIDFERIRRRFTGAGLGSAAQASRLTHGELLAALFLPGFSTADRVSDVSGRGVGLDVVKRNIESLGGQVDAIATGPATIVQHVKSGKVRVLAHWGDARLASLPDVPTLKELGVPIDYAQWSGLFVPAGTPEPVVVRLREAAKAAANDERVKQVMTTAGSPILYLDAPEFQRYVDADAAKMAEIVKKVGKLE